MSDEILTVQEVAALLKVADKTYTMARRGELPAFKVRGRWRFRRTSGQGAVMTDAPGRAAFAAITPRGLQSR
ncbi:helix-turn-helix domain-containing protein [Sorangium cellulosum]|uniref:Helix-turn-helix domain-containing protein n=1 Tax=Sorangium cellulosum So0157-2 TaxID=1254432 RepID=S4XRJ7_SORCE|nr:hypothetical protein SCE1572_08045 [Sorangium cellulosum So0157-2]